MVSKGIAHPTGEVEILEQAQRNRGGSLITGLHVFHELLQVPEFSGHLSVELVLVETALLVAPRRRLVVGALVLEALGYFLHPRPERLAGDHRYQMWRLGLIIFGLASFAAIQGSTGEV